MPLSPCIKAMRARVRRIDTLARRATPEFKAAVREKRNSYARAATARRQEELESLPARQTLAQMRKAARDADIDRQLVALWEAQRLARELL